MPILKSGPLDIVQSGLPFSV